MGSNKLDLVFRKKKDGTVIFSDDSEDFKYKQQLKTDPNLAKFVESYLARKEEVVESEAIASVISQGGDVTNRKQVLGQYTMEFGKYAGKTFHWILTHSTGYGPYIVSQMEFQDEHRKKKGTSNARHDNKMSFREYVLEFKETKEKAKTMLEAKKSSQVGQKAKKVMDLNRTLSSTQVEKMISPSKRKGMLTTSVQMLILCILSSKSIQLKHITTPEYQISVARC